MKIKFFNNFTKRFIGTLTSHFHRTALGRHIYQEITANVMRQTSEVVYRGHLLRFSVPNKLNNYRVKTFATKEPDTLEWVENIVPGSILWDIGANIGLYSIYGAIAQKCRVIAFEPSVFNLELLARNIALNNLQDRVCIFPLPLSDRLGASLFKMSNTEWGGALSTFGQSFDQDGELLRQIFEYQTYGLTMENAVALLKIPQPDYLKIDVDGIEHLILRSGISILEKVDSVLIELNDGFTDQANESKVLLERAGLILYKKCDLGVPNQYNQWWIRPSSTRKN